MMKILTRDEQRTLHHRYKQNDLYRQWSPILSKLQREYGEADVQTLWYVAEQQIVRLRGEQQYREQEVFPIFNELLSECLNFNGEVRTKEQAQRTTSTVMGIVLTMLMNSVENGHENENFDNEPMCMAILDILSGDKYFQSLMNLFFKRNIGYDNHKVVITPRDPMLEKALFESLDEVSKEEINQMVQIIVSFTRRLESTFKDYWKEWESLWCDICADTEFLLLLKNKEPRTTDWNINQKMVFNVIGMFRDKTKSTVSINNINDLLCTINRRSYIANHANYGGPDSVFTKEQHNRILELIEKHILATRYN